MRSKAEAEADEVAMMRRDMATLTAEKEGLLEGNRRANESNDRMEQIKGSLLERAETAEARCRELQVKRDMPK